MRPLVGTLLQTAAFVAGLIACYLAAFMYEKGHARMHNKLDDWWLDLKRNPEFEASPASAFVCKLAFPASSMLWTEFRLLLIVFPLFLSLQLCLLVCLALLLPEMTGVSWSNPLIVFRIVSNSALQWVIPIALATPLLASSCLLYMWEWFFLWAAEGVTTIRRAYHSIRSGEGPSLLLAMVQRALASLPEKSSRIGLKGLVNAGYKLVLLMVRLVMYPLTLFGYLCAIPFCALCVGWLGFLAYGALFILDGVARRMSWTSVVIVLLAGQTSALLFFEAMQWIFRRCWRRQWPFNKSALVISGMCAVATVLFLGPLWFVSDGWTLHVPTRQQMASANAPSAMARYISYSNASDLVVSYGFLIFSLVLLVHRYLWPRLRTAVIALRLAGIGFSRKGLLAVAFVLCLLATGWIPGLLWGFLAKPEIIKDFEDFFGKFSP